ncbi:uncharacterized protein LOC121965266 [Plectropomus leopardus]|uniref:uncharacterized protein LOC121965266 n=1 Tax=Plectropomus leopardus TaxID=160734 RepID=UPI001C4B2F1E|nr:uncharacterized protein LOC121965266 [Plectropomus leopardus]
MDQFHCGLLIFVFLQQIDCLHSVYITDSSDSLRQDLSEFSLVRPIRTSAEGRFLSASVSAHHLRRSKRHAHSTEAPPTDGPASNQKPGWRGRGYGAEEAELFYNVTLFGQELHLRLRPNSRLLAPAATMEWWEESGSKHSQPLRDAGCFYTGQVSNMKDTSVAISNCDGLVRVTSRDPHSRVYRVTPSLVLCFRFSLFLCLCFTQLFHSFILSLFNSFTPSPSRYFTFPLSHLWSFTLSLSLSSLIINPEYNMLF